MADDCKIMFKSVHVLPAGKKIKGFVLLRVIFEKQHTFIIPNFLPHNLFSGHVNIMAPRSTVQFLLFDYLENIS